MTYLTEPEPPRDVPLPVAPGVRRIVAANPGPMTYHGTNTFLLDTDAGTLVIDPGPEDAAHAAAILAAAGRIAAILVTHRHPDHVLGVPALRAATMAPVAAFPPDGPADPLHPDIPLGDGAALHGLLALHMPGHAADHLCFALTLGDGTRALFSGDHVMAWSSSVVSPPGGNMRAYFASLERLLARDDALYLPGHGPALPAPRPHTSALLAHRRRREAEILALLRAGPGGTAALLDALYPGLDTALRRAAERSLRAHLGKLEEEGEIRREGEGWRAIE